MRDVCVVCVCVCACNVGAHRGYLFKEGKTSFTMIMRVFFALSLSSAGIGQNTSMAADQGKASVWCGCLWVCGCCVAGACGCVDGVWVGACGANFSAQGTPRAASFTRPAPATVLATSCLAGCQEECVQDSGPGQRHQPLQ